MIPEKIQNLFRFIDFLNSNIENFNRQKKNIKKYNQLNKRIVQLKPDENFQDKLDFEKISNKTSWDLNPKISINIKLPILNKATELKIWETNQSKTIWDNNIDEIDNLKQSVELNEVAKINDYCKKYIKYRNTTNTSNYYPLYNFFFYLDKVLKHLFGYFNKGAKKEFENILKFELRIIIDDYKELIEIVFKEYTKNKFKKPINLNEENQLLEVLQSLINTGYFKISKPNNYSNEQETVLLTPENWDFLKGDFFKQRINNYPKSYTLSEKINLELEEIESLQVYVEDNKIMKSRYVQLLYSKRNNANNNYDKEKQQQRTIENNNRRDERTENFQKNKIKYHFGFFNEKCPRKQKQILNNSDFEQLINWTISFYENEFKIPEISKPIKKVNTNTTYVQLAFKYLFKELYPNSTYPDTLFGFYSKAFKPYAKHKKVNFDKVKNNFEVEKLMKIDK